MKNVIIVSTSTLFSGEYLEYLTEILKNHFKKVKTLVFIPFARPGGISYDDYTAKASSYFEKLDIKVVGLHTFDNPVEAINNAEAFFTGGGNTFVLVDALHRLNLLEALSAKINSGTPYLGCSAGSNICGLTMHTTNDMPIVQPSSFKTLGLVSFNINPHYLDPEFGSKHMGETRETRIKEFHVYNSQPVIGLREGSWLEVKNNTIILKGNLTARIFEKNKAPYEVESQTDLTHLK